MLSNTKCTYGMLSLLALQLITLPAAGAADEDSAGKTIMARGEVSARNEVGARALARRAPIFIDDAVKTGLVSATQLRMIDGGLLSLQEDTELAINTYAFNAQNKQGSVSMELLKGGLRTVTGALQTQQGTYQLKTPIASIGVRGTHYEAELFNGDLYLAGWQGIIDITVDANKRAFSLGPSEAYRFAVVRVDGSVEFLLNAPPQFGQGHSSNVLTTASLDRTQLAFEAPSSVIVNELSGEIGAITVDNIGEAFVDNDLLVSRLLPDEGIAPRTGAATFDFLASSEFSSSLGAVSDVNLAITVDFANASVPTGNLSFEDGGGEWFAVFNGLVNATALDVQVNFASHNNNLADGNINGLLIDNGTGILGSVNLFEIAQPDITAGGDFLLLERAP